jgi:hypothetical protein
MINEKESLLKAPENHRKQKDLDVVRRAKEAIESKYGPIPKGVCICATDDGAQSFLIRGTEDCGLEGHGFLLKIHLLERDTGTGSPCNGTYIKGE